MRYAPAVWKEIRANLSFFRNDEAPYFSPWKTSKRNVITSALSFKLQQ